MVTRKATSGKKRTAKLTLKKDTIRDLNPPGKSRNVKGGRGPETTTEVTILPSAGCLYTLQKCVQR